MTQFEDDGLRGPNIAFHIGRLNARVESLEGRQDKTDNVLSSMDGKLDEIKVSIDHAVGARKLTAAVARWAFIVLSSGATLLAAVVAALNFLKLS